MGLLDSFNVRDATEEQTRRLEKQLAALQAERRFGVVVNALPHPDKSIPFNRANRAVWTQLRLAELDQSEAHSRVLLKLKNLPASFDGKTREGAEVLVEELRRRGANAELAEAAERPEGSPDVLEQVRKLAELHAAGALTDEEFASKKAELLSRL